MSEKNLDAALDKIVLGEMGQSDVFGRVKKKRETDGTFLLSDVNHGSRLELYY